MGLSGFLTILLLASLTTSHVVTNLEQVPLTSTTFTRPNNTVNVNDITNATNSDSFNTSSTVNHNKDDDNISIDSAKISTNTTTKVHPLANCKYDFKQQPRNPFFTIDQKYLPVVDLIFTIDSSQSRCSLSRRDLESKLNASHPEVVGIFFFRCLDPSGTDVVFQEDEDRISTPTLSQKEQRSTYFPGVFYNYISYLQIFSCRINLKGVELVANLTDLKVLDTFVDRVWDLGELETNPELCKAFKNIMSFSIRNDWSTHRYLHRLARCVGYLDDIVELSFINDSLTSFPEVLHAALPNMRTLDMTNNTLTSPVKFPWPSGSALLPRNLTRTYQFNDEYNYAGSFDIQPNLFSRVFLFDHNRITNLTHFWFSNDFQYISFASNGLQEITENVFDDVPGLQFLNLADNDLETLPENLFARLTNLRRLDLQNNKLKSLPTNIFRNLRQLENLNLAQNRLELLQDGLFTKLVGLTDLQLQKNRIEEISFGAFSIMSVKLKTLDLHHNPLKTFPAILLEMRGLINTNLEYTDIEILDFVEIDRLIPITRLANALNNPTTGGIVNLKAMSLKYSKLRSVVVYNATRETLRMFLMIIEHFTFLVDGSNLTCDCHILNVTHQFQNWTMNGIMTEQEARIKAWQCQQPTELMDKLVKDLKDEDTYCSLEDDSVGGGSGSTSSCPKGCACYMRTKVKSVIVDCQHGGLTSLPARVPEKTQELWLQNNSIQTLEKMPYLALLRSLKLTSNNVQEIPKEVLQFIPELRELHVDDNLLTGLQPDLAHLTQLQDVRLAGNPFRCDCHTLWMKDWLLKHKNVAQDWTKIKCSTGIENGKDFLSVSYDEFICKTSASLQELAVLIATPLTLAIIVFIFCVVAFIQRKRLKVLLYIHTGMHPFDRDPPDDRALYDITVCCDFNARAWVLQNIIEPLEKVGRYTVFFYSRDAFAGFTTSENVRHCVKNSRRLVVVLGKDWQNNDLLVTATKEGLNKCRNEMVHFMTVVIHQLATKDIDNKDIQHYIQRGRYITTEGKHFTKKLLYKMPHVKVGKAAPQIRHLGVVERPSCEPQPIATCTNITIAENEQDDLTEQIRHRHLRIQGHVSLVSELEVHLHLQSEQTLDKANQNPQIIQRQIREQPSFKEVSRCDNVAESGKTESRPSCNKTIAKSQNIVKLKGKGIGKLPRDTNRNGAVAGGVVHENQKLSAGSEAVADPKSVFVWYADRDLPFVLKNIVQPLENLGHSCVLQDRDFCLGAPIQENIVHAAETCTRSIFVLSNQTPENEWFTFVFHVVFDCCLQSRDHRVALVMRRDVDVTKFVEEIQQVIKTSALLSEDDPWFAKRLNKFVNFEGHEIC